MYDYQDEMRDGWHGQRVVGYKHGLFGIFSQQRPQLVKEVGCVGAADAIIHLYRIITGLQFPARFRTIRVCNTF